MQALADSVKLVESGTQLCYRAVLRVVMVTTLALTGGAPGGKLSRDEAVNDAGESHRGTVGAGSEEAKEASCSGWVNGTVASFLLRLISSIVFPRAAANSL
jgi:hypothetical protein